MVKYRREVRSTFDLASKFLCANNDKLILPLLLSSSTFFFKSHVKKLCGSLQRFILSMKQVWQTPRVDQIFRSVQIKLHMVSRSTDF